MILYIDKNAKTNYEIEMLRSAAMNWLNKREDVIVAASVAGLGNPEQFHCGSIETLIR